MQKQNSKFDFPDCLFRQVSVQSARYSNTLVGTTLNGSMKATYFTMLDTLIQKPKIRSLHTPNGSNRNWREE